MDVRLAVRSSAGTRSVGGGLQQAIFAKMWAGYREIQGMTVELLPPLGPKGQEEEAVIGSRERELYRKGLLSHPLKPTACSQVPHRELEKTCPAHSRLFLSAFLCPVAGTLLAQASSKRGRGESREGVGTLCPDHLYQPTGPQSMEREERSLTGRDTQMSSSQALPKAPWLGSHLPSLPRLCLLCP